MKNSLIKNHFFLVILSSLCFSFLLCNNANAQSAESKYQTETIYLRSYNYVKNGQKYPKGFLGLKLKKELEVSPGAMAEYKNYEKNSYKSLAFLTAAMGAYIAGLYISEEKEALRGGFFLGSLASLTVSIPFAFKAQNSYTKSIWIRNGDVLK